MPDIHDITVEEPTQDFQNVRDYCDSLFVHKHLADGDCNFDSHNYKKFEQDLQKYKIGKKQAQRVFDILEYIDSIKKGKKEHDWFWTNITQRITYQLDVRIFDFS